jgi:chemotaxis methyl-accepting protein methylase
VTAFFRDPDVFEALARRVIPALARSVNPIRVWSAGCASGAELYSVAVLLAQAGLLSRCTLLGTDCRPSAIALARSGIVDDAELAALPERLRAACFEAASDGRWRPVAAIRDHIRWKVADVTRGLEAGPWDLILWRNVAIYLRTDTAGALREALANSLCSGGFLVTGRAESMPQLRRVARGVYRSAGGDDGW